MYDPDKCVEECVFCRIRDGELQDSFVLDWPLVYAIMSLEQPNPYKVLVVPKPHVTTIYELSDELAAAVFRATVQVSRAVLAASRCDGMSIVQSNGAAGQQDMVLFVGLFELVHGTCGIVRFLGLMKIVILNFAP